MIVITQLDMLIFLDCNTFEDLQEVFENKIIPLLQEYFYDDWEKIDLVLNQNGFINKKGAIKDLFANNDFEDDEKKIYELSKEALLSPENYKKIYTKNNEEGEQNTDAS